MNAKLRPHNEIVFSPGAFVRLYEQDRASVVSARFIPPRLGSNEVGGSVRVVLKPGSKYASKFTAAKQSNK